MKKEVSGTLDSGNVWTEYSNADAESFLGFIQIFSKKTASTLKST